LIWGNRISSDFNHYGSQKACAEANVDHEVLGMKWRLPTINEFENASSHGMKSALPNMNYWFWSSTPVKVKKKYRRRRGPPAQVFLWDGSEEKTDVGDLKDGASVRCVTKE
jgi:predicted class III extradiol MEMO1 family dioxygenase